MKVVNKFLIAIIAIIFINFNSNVFSITPSNLNPKFFTYYQEKALQDQAENFSSKIFDYLRNTEYLSGNSTNTDLLNFLDSNSNKLKQLFNDSFYFYMNKFGRFKEFKSNVIKVTEDAKKLKISTYNYFINFIKRSRETNLVNFFDQNIQIKNVTQTSFENIANECLNILYQEINKSWFARTKEKFSWINSWIKKRVEPQAQSANIQTFVSDNQHVSCLGAPLDPIEISSESQLLENLIKKNLGDLNSKFESTQTVDNQITTQNAISYQEFFDKHDSLVKKLEDGFKTKNQKPGFLGKIKSFFIKRKTQDTEVIFKNLLLKHLNDLKLRFLNFKNVSKETAPLKKEDFSELYALIDRYIKILNTDESSDELKYKKTALLKQGEAASSKTILTTSKTKRILSALMKMPILAAKAPFYLAKKGLKGTTYLFDRFVAKTKIGRIALLFVVLSTIEAFCKFKKIDLNLQSCTLDRSTGIFSSLKKQISCQTNNVATVTQSFKKRFIEEVSNPRFENILNFIKRIILGFRGDNSIDNLNLSSDNGRTPDENCSFICRFLIWISGKNKEEVDLKTHQNGFFDNFYRIGILYALFNLV
ncbi:MAG: hypothetical protein WC436_01925 [Candidatus Babeliales bacterium]